MPTSSSSSSSSSFCYIDTPPSSPRLTFLTSLFKRRVCPPPPDSAAKPLPSPPLPQSDVAETRGICIRFPHEYHPQVTRKERLARLQQTITVAVLDAGMSRSPGNTTRSSEIRNRGYRTPDALFCGTYGQLMAALEGAGLSATPSAGQDLSGYTRLGALFVAQHGGASGVQLRKITLWG